MTVGLVIARGGSVRMPRKNVTNLCGRPLVEWSILQAQCSREIDLVVVGTDDDEIAEIGKRNGCKIIRDPEIAIKDPGVVSASVIFVNMMEELIRDGFELESAVNILPTSPLRLPWDFDHAIRMFREAKVEQVIPVSCQREHLVYQWLDETHVEILIAGMDWRMADQGGGFGVVSVPWYIEQHKDRYKEVQDRLPFPHVVWTVSAIGLEAWQRYDIDDRDDFVICEKLMEHYLLAGGDPYKSYAQGGQIWHNGFRSKSGNLMTERM